MEQIRLDIIPKGLMPVCHASQYDKGRVIRFNLMDGLQPYTLDGTETLEVDVRKTDMNIVTADVTNTSSTYVDIVTTEQMTACEGDNLGELKITKGDVVVASINFILRVEEDPLKDGIESETEIANLSHQISDLVSEQYDSENVIFDAEPTEDHGIGYTVTSEGIKAAIDAKPDNLSDLGDVNISSPTSNQALVWNNDAQEWTNGEVSTVGSIDDLNDVDTSGKATGDSLRYDGNEWKAKPTTISLTQAEYDALQTKERNTHYVITDAPNLNPTASDIEYSSGVTVADCLDDLTTGTTPTITVTKNSGAWGFSNVTSKKYGGVVNLALRITGSNTAVASGSDGFSGSIDTLRPNIDTYTITYYGANLLVIRLTTTGDLYVRNVNSSSFTLPTSDWLNVSLTYLV